MTEQELRQLAEGDGQLMLTMSSPNQRYPARLFGRVGPRVDIVNEGHGKAVVRVDKSQLRKWLERNGGKQ